jgi:two-component system sensor histidine kinase/response regulator
VRGQGEFGVIATGNQLQILISIEDENRARVLRDLALEAGHCTILVNDQEELRRELDEGSPGVLVLSSNRFSAVQDRLIELKGAADQECSPPAVLLVVEAGETDAVITRMLGKGADDYLGVEQVKSAFPPRLKTLSRMIAAEHSTAKARAELELVRNTIQTGVIIIDAETLEIVDVNPEAARIIQFEPEDLLGKSCKEHLCNRSEPGCPVLNGRFEYLNTRSVVRRRDGTDIPVLKTVVPAETGGRKLLFDCFVDISELQAKETELLEQKRVLQAILDGLTDVVGLQRTDHTIVSYNRAGYEALGRSREEVDGHKCWELIGRKAPCRECAPSRALQSGEIETVEKFVPEIGRWFNVTGVPIQDDSGEVSMLVEQLRDITEQKESESRLQETLEELEAVFESSLVGIMILENRVITKVNRQMAAMLGYEREELMGQSPECLHLSREHYVDFGEKYYWRLAEEEMVEVEYPLRHKNGRPVWCLFHSKALVPPDLSKGAVCVVTDISSRKLQELELKEAKDHLQQVMETAATAVFTVGTDMVITSVNRAFCDITGYEENEILGLDCRTLKGDPCMENCGLFDPGRKDPILEKVCKITTKDGRRLTIRKNAQVLWDEFGRPRSGIESFVDITELMDALEAAEESTRLKACFLANMSHEIRTPMNGVLGMAQLLAGTELNDEQKEYCERINASADSLLGVINSILDFSKLEASKLVLDESEFNLGEVVEEACDSLALRAHEKGLEFICDLEPGLPDLLVGDPGRLRQILTNLIGNAIKFTEEGEVRVRVTCNTPENSEFRHGFRFDIEDTGIGIPAEKMDSLFESFVQADLTATRRFGGSGLGLTISRQLADLMNGTIGVESEEGAGSRFRLELPLLVKKPASLDPGLPSLGGKQILIVDDNENSRQVLFRRIEAWGGTCAEARDGLEALDLMRSARNSGHPFDLVLVDHKMPGMDGEELGRCTQSEEPGPETPLILLTSVGLIEEAVRLRGDIFTDYLTKPISPARLQRAMDQVFCRMVVEGPDLSRQTTPVDSGVTSLAGKRILLVEDNPTNRLLAVRLLGKMDLEVETAEDGAAALEVLGKARFDLVLMDVQMPVMDGLEATRRIRAAGPHGMDADIPIVALTAHSLQGDREMCLDAGMDDYITKPVNLRLLRQVLERQLLDHSRDEQCGPADQSPEKTRI